MALAQSDIIVGDESFGLTPEIIAQQADLRDRVAELLSSVGQDNMMTDIQRLYDNIKSLEQQGLRGRELFLAIGQNPDLLSLYNTYFYVLYETVEWGKRIGRVLNTEGEIIPEEGLLVGELDFGITEDTVLEDAQGRTKDAKILEEEGVEIIISKSKQLFDAVKKMEAEGLRNSDLYERVHADSDLLEISKRYYGFIRRRMWGYRMQSVW
ncbi:hypothetical protein M0P48_05590 [Candidatus Gracilibacteria bacterium]|nr:hypothetical protein [Candidatus Gracilibacteria bacterium]